MSVDPDTVRMMIAFYRDEHRRTEQRWERDQVAMAGFSLTFLVLMLLSVAAGDVLLVGVCGTAAIGLSFFRRKLESLQERGRETYKDLNLALLRDLQFAVDQERRECVEVGGQHEG